MKERMFKYFTANSTRRYIDILNEMVSNYNNTRHTSIKMTPAKASMKVNEKVVWMNLYCHQLFFFLSCDLTQNTFPYLYI